MIFEGLVRESRKPVTAAQTLKVTMGEV